MSAIFVKEHGGVEQLVQGPLPFAVGNAVEAGKALVEVKYAGLNFIDVYYRTGLYKKPILPYVTCDEGSGVIVALPSGANTSHKVGDRVAFFRGSSGSAATHTLVNLEDLYTIPDGMPFDTAAAVLLQGATAHYLARSCYEVKAGDVVLVQAAAGGTGLILSQICSSLGAIVIGTCGGEEKQKIATTVGKVRYVVDYNKDGGASWVEEVKAIAAAHGGVNVVYDGVGKTTFLGSLACLKKRGHLVTFGNASGPVDPISPLLLTQHGSITLQRPSLNAYSDAGGEIQWRVKELFEWIATGSITVTSGAVFPLTEAAKAFTALEGRATSGKVLLDCTAVSA